MILEAAHEDLADIVAWRLVLVILLVILVLVLCL
jgi:hypothetical protein